MIAVYVVFITDTVVTALTLIGLNKKLEELDRISESIKNVSDKMTDKIGNKSLNALQTAQESAVQASLAKAELQDKYNDTKAELQGKYYDTKEELQQRYEELKASLTAHRHYGVGRLLRAFPNVRYRTHQDIVEDIKRLIRIEN